jgi:AcrR family transcriptional regulator
MKAPASARARARAELTREIVSASREELASVGAAGFSLRAVARRLGMVPSALYRYFPNRDALLTALIIDAYQAVGAAAAAADHAAGARRPLARWMAVASAVRAWAHRHPHEWALVYGSPVPGYEAPRDTVEAALAVTKVVSGIFAAAAPTGKVHVNALPAAPKTLASVLRPIEEELLPGRGPETVVAALVAWTQLVGMVSMELFGHFKGATTDFDAVFDYAMRAVGAVSGLG